jgi:uncharacterized protein with HEPN domain
MKPEKRDDAYLWDMLDAAREARDLIGGLGYDELMSKRVVRLALERLLEITGEAARNVSPRRRGRHETIPWKGIIGLRNAIAHEYGEIDYQRIYTVATKGVPRLVSTLEKVLEIK